MPQTEPLSLVAIIDRIRGYADADRVALGKLVKAFGNTSFLPALMIPAVLVVSPLSGIPLFSSICGLMIALIAAQMLVGRSYLWLPEWLERRSVSGAKLDKAMLRVRRFAGWIDRLSTQRFRFLFNRPFSIIPPIMALICGLAMPLLELVPFSSSLLGTAVIWVSVGILSRDGLFLILAGIWMTVAAAIPIWVWTHLTT